MIEANVPGLRSLWSWNRNRDRARLSRHLHNPVTPSLPDEKKSIFLKQFAYLLAGKLPTLGHNPLQIG